MKEIETKLERIRRFLKKKKLTAVLFGNQNNFSWITGGGDARVPLATDAAAASVLVTARTACLLTSTIEAPRLYAEEVSQKYFAPLIHPWHQRGQIPELIGKMAGKGAWGSDNGVLDSRNLGAELARLRWQLLPEEIHRYREVGLIAVRTLETVAREIRPGMMEHEIAARLAFEIMQPGAAPHLILVATDERIRRYRHPLPRDKRLRRHAMLVVCAKKYGLIASATRLVYFGRLPRNLRRRHDAVCRVDAALNLATRPGARGSDIFRAAQEAYAREGFRDEWLKHHQGGATGYAGREWLGTPACSETVLDGQAFAWNPSIAGTKSEDTVLVCGDKLEILTAASARWPMSHADVGGRIMARPDILVR